jgi:hypothetical protein
MRCIVTSRFFHEWNIDPAVPPMRRHGTLDGPKGGAVNARRAVG